MSKTSKAFEALQKRGRIKYFSMIHLGFLPEAVCVPGAETVRKIYASGQIDNEFTIALCEILTDLLNEIIAQ